MEFCSKFLGLVANEMKEVDSPYDVFRFDFDPSHSDCVFMKSYRKQNEYSFIPEWFIKEVKASGCETERSTSEID